MPPMTLSGLSVSEESTGGTTVSDADALAPL
jgi:hypothetical protein